METHNTIIKDEDPLIRQLGLFDSTMMMMGIVIGSGIFLTTGIMVQAVPSAPMVLLAWLLGGLLILAGALTYAELGVSLPEAGGQYVYLREAYGHLYGFLFGWKMFLGPEYPDRHQDRNHPGFCFFWICFYQRGID